MPFVPDFTTSLTKDSVLLHVLSKIMQNKPADPVEQHR